MQTTVETITPKMAEEWLKLVPKFQRNVNDQQVNKLATAISDDEWCENGATIVFNENGELVDGQHRLHAIVKANKSVKSLVARGIESGEDIFNTIDDSKARRPSDFLNVNNKTGVISMARHYWFAINGKFPEKSREVIPNLTVIKIARRFSDSMSQVYSECGDAGRLTRVSAFFAFLVWYHRHIIPLDQERISSFIKGLQLGEGLTVGDPVLSYRNRCIAEAANIRKNYRLSQRARQALLLKAFYAHIEGRQMPKLMWNPKRETFPELINEIK